MITFVVPGNPLPKERPRFAGGHAYTSDSTRDYEATVALYAREAMGGSAPLEGDLSVSLAFWRADRRLVDLDNFCKVVCDAMNGIVWHDDVQIVKLAATKDTDRGRPRVEVRVTVWK